MNQLFVIERRQTFIVDAKDMQDAIEIMGEIESYGTQVWESETTHEATPRNISKSWANMEPSNRMDGVKLKDIAPELFLSHDIKERP